MKTRLTIGTLILATWLAPGIAAAGDVVHHSGQASVHSARAVGEIALSGAKLVTGAVAVPLMASGAAGTLSGEAGSAMWRAAGGDIGTPLPVADDTYITTPSPRDAMAE